ncbi:Formate dehydrogenase iron-sulfur subunit [Leminorella richardii]|uniref:Formate dehydrogenase iron-sulfur subunit n=1 Tax=Leminorella richardii TaxID=158841 RepID=A0A2X4UP81_9GAMM|nr:4Fe-4S dicluster domain-containing protein [Leminorella richardii]SQI40359.1 Formate dehydrogenase iron-sulfur subunit [Leminorella richardii]
MSHSRRRFLFAVGSAALLGIGSGKVIANAVTKKGKRYVLIHDETRCIGCNECAVACAKANDVPIGYSRLSMIPLPKSAQYDNEERFFRHSCQQCDDAPCIDVCPTGASYMDENGIVQINKALCLGCDYCVSACPYDVRYIHPTKHIADKCDFCSEKRLSQGFMPVCVRICPKNALFFGEEESAEMQYHLHSGHYYVHRLKNVGQPHIYRIVSL